MVFTTLDISQLKKLIDGYENIYRVNSFYIIGDHARGYIEEKEVNKYFIFDSTDENKELLKKYNDVFNGIRNKIKKISGDECDYEKDYMKIKFNSDDDLPLKKPLKFHLMTITKDLFLKKIVNFIHKSF